MSPYLVVQHLILVLQRGQKRVLGQGIRPTGVLLIGPANLLVERLHVERQQAREVERLALLGWEPRSLVQVGGVEEGRAGQGAPDGAGGAEGKMGEFGRFGRWHGGGGATTTNTTVLILV